MGAFGDIGAGVGQADSGAINVIRGFRDKRRATQAFRDAQAEKAAQLEAEKKIDWTPAYQTDLVEPFKGTQSPAARAYLQSFMTGDSPLLSDPSTELPSAGARRQQNFDQRFGSPDELLRQDAAARKQTYESGSPGEVENYIKGYKPPKLEGGKTTLDRLLGR
jgi:hypothetical protein